ncbi:DUF599 domain-containing protein [Puniceibacterium sp. IMCC21224]|uniref:DUF599 domain-containing protein n=1 Tax=Puniceibacterium sp. IMCC21224 TaxID=1618204 RepID=UPI00064DA23E|nr:DUF599 domain-containing protein [Puniceibacterium sp. IMCC21224]KMK65591.1 hypothetical protein IMCC21224_11423 [Puniceibacterium sp. IMCC21224]
MLWMDQMTLFTRLDYTALAVLLVGWLLCTPVIEHPPTRRPSVSALMADYRREWMRHFVTREPRIFDSQIIGNMRQGTAFFASASMIAIGGGFALIGNADILRGVAQDLTLGSAPTIVWEIKLMLMLGFATNAFLKFVWSHRLFGYCAVLMAAVPNDPTSPLAFPRAAKAAEINVTAARSYNRGLRSVYFGIASAAWLLGAWPLLVAATFTLLVVMRREFTSASREVLLEDSDQMANTVK